MAAERERAAVVAAEQTRVAQELIRRAEARAQAAESRTERLKLALLLLSSSMKNVELELDLGTMGDEASIIEDATEKLESLQTAVAMKTQEISRETPLRWYNSSSRTYSITPPTSTCFL
jgi:hypothetical protein